MPPQKTARLTIFVLVPLQQIHFPYLILLCFDLTFLQALQYMTENGCRWRALPKEFGNWFTIYRRFRYWITHGIFDLIEKELRSQAIDIKGIKALALDSTYIKVHRALFIAGFVGR